jgi:hypothetical protein
MLVSFNTEKLSLYYAVEIHTVMRLRGSNIFHIIGSQMAVRLKKGKVIPVTGRRYPYGCETSRFPHFLDNRLTDGVEVVSFTIQPLFTSGRFLVLILLVC